MDTQVVMQALAEALAPHFKHTAPSGTPSTPYYFGPGGLFGVAGLERDLISTRVQPRGLASFLPAYPSITTNPLFPYLTGFQAATGSVADGVCDECPTAGPGKSCIQTAQFGRYCVRTRELEINAVGQRINRGEFLDYRLINDPLVNDFGSLLAQSFALNSQDQAISGAEVLMRYIEAGIEFQNLLCPQTFTGSPANNSAGGGYKEFPGLDILIGVNKVDALTGDECPSLDSDIKDFNYGLVTDLTLPSDIVTVMTYLMRYLKHNAAMMNFNPVKWVLVMRDGLFYEMTSIWPCRYLTDRCWVKDTVNIDAVGGVNAEAATRMRDEMRAGSYLLIDGERFPVIIDDCITEETSGDTVHVTAGCFASDIYVVPMTIRGGYPVTYWEYLDYSKTALPAARQGQVDTFFWSDGGRFLWHAKPPTNWCIQSIAKIEPRIILRTPHLAGRLTNVQYCPLQHVREPLPDQPYFVDGGVTEGRVPPSLYSDWNLPRQ